MEQFDPVTKNVLFFDMSEISYSWCVPCIPVMQPRTLRVYCSAPVEFLMRGALLTSLSHFENGKTSTVNTGNFQWAPILMLFNDFFLLFFLYALEL